MKIQIQLLLRTRHGDSTEFHELASRFRFQNGVAKAALDVFSSWLKADCPETKESLKSRDF
jgi:hypothetical protein